MKNLRLSVLIFALFASACGKSSPTSPSPPGGGEPPPTGNRTAVLIGAGDIGLCGSSGIAATGRLIQDNPGDVFLAGDIAYPNGSAESLRNCFAPFWGHASSRWHPVPGNHDYEQPNATPYFQFFGPAAGAPGFGYYRLVLGEWLVLMLNSEIDARAGSGQYEFVRQSLQTRPARCQMAIWHRPLFSSGPNGPYTVMRDVFKLLDDNDVDVVVNGHEHYYERFSRQDADGRLDENGVRQFIVGTGGANLYDFVRVAPNSTVRISTYGIMRFTLLPDSYEWQFVQASGAIGDSGATQCH